MNKIRAPLLWLHERRSIISAVFFALSVIIAWAVVLGSITGLLRPEPPYHVERDGVFRVSEPFLCPGQVLTYHLTVHVNRAPIVALRARNIWDVERGYNIIKDEHPDFIVWPEKGIISSDVSYLIPFLPPGKYELRSATMELNSQPAIVRIPFEVPENCP